MRRLRFYKFRSTIKTTVLIRYYIYTDASCHVCTANTVNDREKYALDICDLLMQFLTLKAMPYTPLHRIYNSTW